MVMAARVTIPRKFRAVFSYRVATRRHCFNRFTHRSTLFRSLYSTRSYSRGSVRLLRGGITTSAPTSRDRRGQGIAVIPLVREYRSELLITEQYVGMCHVGILARAQMQGDRIPQGIHRQMQLGPEPAATIAEGLIAPGRVHPSRVRMRSDDRAVE
jgi:hypothetical protein